METTAPKKTACKIVFCDVVDQYIHDFLIFLEHEELEPKAKEMRLEFAKRTCGRAFSRTSIAFAIVYSAIRTKEGISIYKATEKLGKVGSTFSSGNLTPLRNVGIDNRAEWKEWKCHKQYQKSLPEMESRVLELLPSEPPGITWTTIRKVSTKGSRPLYPEDRYYLRKLLCHGFIQKDGEKHAHYWKVKH